MSIVKVMFKIYNPVDVSKYVEVDGIVDTGATYSVASSPLLDSIVEGNIGGVIIEVMGRKGAVTVIFGEEGDVNVLGVTALEALGLEVNVVKGTLKEAEQLLL